MNTPAAPADRPDRAADAAPPGLGARALAGAVYYLPSVAVMIGLALLWQFAVTMFGVKEYILPTPLAALKTLADPNYRWTANFLATLYAVLGAFVLSALLGVALAVVIVWNELLMRTVMPVLILSTHCPRSRWRRCS